MKESDTHTEILSRTSISGDLHIRYPLKKAAGLFATKERSQTPLMDISLRITRRQGRKEEVTVQGPDCRIFNRYEQKITLTPG